ncbi:MAG: hypothetical protein KJS87_08810 [Alphaproteobacteria bacterium]|nr:hypothetical protein [Alphaproteobacteria bacterium]
MKKNKKGLPPPYVEATKDMRHEGTFEVQVPVPNRVKPTRVPRLFDSEGAALSWLHSPEGEDAIRQILKEAGA